jgi:hypothetical protein
MRYVDLYWLIAPGFPLGRSDMRGLLVLCIDASAMMAIGGLWLAVYTWRLSIRMQLPMYDFDLEETGDEHAKQPAAA